MSAATLLLVSLLVPAAGAVLVWTLPEREPGLARGLGLALAVLECAALLTLVSRFDPTGAPVQLEAAWPWIPSLGVAPRLGLDGLSVPALAAVALVVPLGLLAGQPGDGSRSGARTARSVGAALLAQAAAVGILLARDVGTLAACWLLEAVAGWLLLTAEGDDEARRLADRRLLLGAGGGFALMVAAVTLSVLHYDLSQGQHGFEPRALAGILPPAATQGALLGAAVFAAWARLGAWPFHGSAAAVFERAGPSSAIHVLGLAPGLAVVPLLRLGIPAAPLVYGEWAPVLAGLGVLTLLWGGVASLARADRPAAVLGAAAVGQGGIAIVFLACTTTPAWIGMAIHVAGVAVAVAAAAVVLPALRAPDASRDGSAWRLEDLPRRRPGLYVGLVIGGAGLVGAPLLATFDGLWVGLSAVLVGDSVELPRAHLLGLFVLLGLALHGAAWMRVVERLRRPVSRSDGAVPRVPAAAGWPTLVAVGVALGVSLAAAARPATMGFASNAAAREAVLTLHARRCRAIPARELGRPVEIDRVVADCRAPRAKIIQAYGLEIRRAALSAGEVQP